MPNWVRNVIDVSGGARDMDAFVNGMKSEHSDFDFNKIIPMPESLNVTSGGISDNAIMYYLSDRLQKSIDDVERNDDIKLIKYTYTSLRDLMDDCRNMLDRGSYKPDDLYEQGRVYVDNYHKYGAIDWYDWCCANWGTKWNACDVSVTRSGMFQCTVVFDTAWSMPEFIIKTLIAMYPNLSFDGKYADEDLGSMNCGAWHSDKGSSDFSYDGCDNCLKFACDIWGYEYDEEKDAVVFE